IAAKRLGMEVKAYEDKIVNEYWVYGYDAVNEKAADEQVLAKCGESLNGSDVVEFQTFFGPVKVTFSKCPLIKEPESIDFGRILEANRGEVERTVRMSLSDKRRFVNEYITTSRFGEIFK